MWFRDADAEFTAKTHRELARLASEARALRRGRPDHPWCGDREACRHCAAIRDKHRLINDHLAQLDMLADH